MVVYRFMAKIAWMPVVLVAAGARFAQPQAILPPLAVIDAVVRSWWFWSALLLLVAALAEGMVLLRRQRVLRQRNAELERAARERAAALEAECAKVREEMRQAEAAGEAKGRLLAYAARKIRGSLSDLLELTPLLEDDPGGSQDTIQLIQSSGQTLLRTIDDVLDLSNLEAGAMELEIAPFQLSRALEESVGSFRAAAGEKGLRLDLNLAPDLPAWVAGDEARVRQAVSNLVSNGVQFTRSGEVAVSAAVEGPDQDPCSIRIEVRDTGVGIAPDRIGRLFSGFGQQDSSITRYGRVGFGLAISRLLAERMGGTIDVESKEGVGSTFRLTIPLGRTADPAPAGAEAAAQDVRKLRVLLAEDDKIQRIVAVKMIQKLGITADLAESGVQAIAAVLEKPYDLVLMDLHMPDMDGMAATREIRNRLGAGRQPAICGLSAHDAADFLQPCLSAGMDDYLTKPLDPEKLRRMLVELAARGRGDK